LQVTQVSTPLTTAAEANVRTGVRLLCKQALVTATPDHIGRLPSHVSLGSLKYARFRQRSGPSAQEQHAAALEAAVAEWAFVYDSFAALPDALKAEQRLLGLVLRRPAVHAEISCRPTEFVDPCHEQIHFYAWALWRLRQPASALAVGDCVRHITPLLRGSEKPTAIETLVFETLGWRLDEYCLELERRRDHAILFSDATRAEAAEAIRLDKEIRERAILEGRRAPTNGKDRLEWQGYVGSEGGPGKVSQSDAVATDPDMSVVRRNRTAAAEFPLDVLGSAAPWVKTVAESKSAPVSYVALNLLVVTAGCIGPKRRVVALGRLGRAKHPLGWPGR
jgi:hypothetical protein